MESYSFWDVIAVLTLIFCFFVCSWILARIIYLVVKSFKEKPEEAIIGKKVPSLNV
ncbi:MAG: hypothetical protein Q8N22_01910 [bacterium]|nr:hypothetical protein [bacterium]